MAKKTAKKKKELTDEDYIVGEITIPVYDLNKFSKGGERALFLGEHVADATDGEDTKYLLSGGIGAFSRFLSVNITPKNKKKTSLMIGVTDLFDAVKNVKGK